ncbi:DUF494 family protein [Bdellovibrionota bacterium]
MKERVFVIVSFMSQFEQSGKDLFYSEEELIESLLDQNFSEKEIQDTYDWIAKVTLFDKLQLAGEISEKSSPRVFDPEETFRFSSKARGFLWKLRAAGIIDEVQQEEVITKLLALDVDEINEDDVSHVAALTLFPKMSNLLIHNKQHKITTEPQDPLDSLH